jgi:hypothetical protein
MRLQRTRSSPSAPHSPLRRRPLGGGSIFLACALWATRSVAAGQESGPLAQEFERLHAHESLGGSICSDEERHTGISEISIERTVCYGACPSYTLILKADGSAEYQGRVFTRRKGRFVGKVNVAEFERLARYALAMGFFDLNDGYTCAVTDNPSVFVAVASPERRKLVYHYAPDHQTAPATLDVFEELIDRVGENVKWKKTR